MNLQVKFCDFLTWEHVVEYPKTVNYEKYSQKYNRLLRIALLKLFAHFPNSIQRKHLANNAVSSNINEQKGKLYKRKLKSFTIPINFSLSPVYLDSFLPKRTISSIASIKNQILVAYNSIKVIKHRIKLRTSIIFFLLFLCRCLGYRSLTQSYDISWKAMKITSCVRYPAAQI